jgi:hypothetical protein
MFSSVCPWCGFVNLEKGEHRNKAWINKIIPFVWCTYGDRQRDISFPLFMQTKRVTFCAFSPK